ENAIARQAAFSCGGLRSRQNRTRVHHTTTRDHTPARIGDDAPVRRRHTREAPAEFRSPAAASLPQPSTDAGTEVGPRAIEDTVPGENLHELARTQDEHQIQKSTVVARARGQGEVATHVDVDVAST